MVVFCDKSYLFIIIKVTSIVSVSEQIHDQLQCLYSLQCNNVQSPMKKID